MNDPTLVKQQAAEIKLYGLLANWHQLTETQVTWLVVWFSWELAERKKRGLERRLRSAKIGKFKPLVDFDWQWPDKIDQQTIAALMQLDFINEATNIIFLGSNGVGKSTIAQNLAYQAAIQGHSEWGEVFPNAACVVSLIDRLIHHSEILSIEGGSYRMKEAKERSTKKSKSKSKSKTK
jgi:DNA replication protein DnaC